MKTFTMEEVTEKHFGKLGTKKRNKHELNLLIIHIEEIMNDEVFTKKQTKKQKRKMLKSFIKSYLNKVTQ